MAAELTGGFAQHLQDHLPGRTVTEDGDLIVITRRHDHRDLILAVAARLANQPQAPMQPLADELAPFGVDVSGNPEHLHALAVLVTNVRHGMTPSEKALACLMGVAA